MSITIRDVMKLPCMREAQVVAGASGLENVVSAVSVLEYTEPTELQEELLRSTVYTGRELILTAFASVKDSVEDQCSVIRRLNATGSVGVLLYYVGVFLKQIDQRVLDTADELGFVVICMPKNRYNLRYSEAITEIQNAIFMDQNRSVSFVPEVLETVSALPASQRSLDSFLRIISDRLQLTLIITDRTWGLLHYAAWPNMLERDILVLLEAMAGAEKCSEEVQGPEGQTWYFCTVRLKNNGVFRQNLIVAGAQRNIPGETANQIAEAIALFWKMWDGPSENPGTLDFIRAVIRDEPVKMRQLARSLNIEETRIHNMLLFRPLTMTMSDYRDILHIVRENLSRRCATLAAEVYDDYVVVLLDDGISGDWIAMLTDIREQIKAAQIDCQMMYSCDLENTTEVREAYLSMTQRLDTAVKLYRHAGFFSAYELQFVGQCQEIISQGEAAVQSRLQILRVLRCGDAEQERQLRETLAAFYFDGYMNVTRTAELMFVHKNTIKYRLKKISEKLGCRVTDMPEMLSLYQALALSRLLEN